MNLLALIFIVFIFWGEPDIWDNVHAWVMKKTSSDVKECVVNKTRT